MTKAKVLVGGCFDILHAGHIRFLKKARSFGDYLVVFLEPDENIKKLKGKDRPIHNLVDRKQVLSAIKFIDEIITVPKNANDEIYKKLVIKIKPQVIVITNGDPIKNIKLAQAKLVGARLKIIKKYKSYSSSAIVNSL